MHEDRIILPGTSVATSQQNQIFYHSSKPKKVSLYLLKACLLFRNWVTEFH